MKKIIGLIIISVSLLMIVFTGCGRNQLLTGTESSGIQTFPEMADMESTLSELAALLPKAMEDSELATIIRNEADRNRNDEPYALWSKIADIPTPSGITLRAKIQQVQLNRTLGKTTADAQAFTTSLDSIEYLQVYIHDFEDWVGTKTIPVTFVPLTINDIDVTTLTLFDSTGNQSLLELDNTAPDYPIIVVGLNEGPHNENIGLNKITSARTEIMDKMYLIDDKEPWFKGKAEIYMVSAGTREYYHKKRAVELEDVNHEGNWYNRDYNLFEWETPYWGDYVGVGVIERDGCCRDYTVTILHENYEARVSATGNDDFIGRILSVEYNHPNPHRYEPGDVKFYLKY